MPHIFPTNSRLADLFISNLYPGSPFDREVLSLDLMHALVDTITIEIFQPLISPNMIQSILNVFLSSWERSRHLASDLLLKFDAPWVSYTSIGKILSLFEFALHLTGSARQGESDAGALIIRYPVFSIDIFSLKD